MVAEAVVAKPAATAATAAAEVAMEEVGLAAAEMAVVVTEGGVTDS